LRALEVPVFGQQEGECGNTSLKAVLWFHGKRPSARLLGRLVGVNRDGTDHAGLIRGAAAAQASVFAKANGTLRELAWFVEHGYPVIVGWWSREPGDEHLDDAWPLRMRREKDCGHFSVVTNVDSDRVTLMDPQWDLRGGRWHVVGRRTMSRRDFLEVWYDTDTPRYRRVDRWYMVVHYTALRFASRFPGGRDHAPRPLPHR
jgi:predicted double-glycine peptidase